MGQAVNVEDLQVSDAPELVARLYSTLHAGNPGDVEFYARACQGAKRVLELGSGAGRIALALAERGHDVLGVELDPALLGLARERQRAREAELGRALPVHFEQGDMTMFARRGFARVLIPYSALWCLDGSDAKSKCLTNAAASLARGGRLLFDVYDADAMAPDFEEHDGDEIGPVGEQDAVEQDDFEELHRVTCDGIRYRVWERNTWDPAAQRTHVDYRFVESTRGRRLTASPCYALSLTHSVLWRYELAELLESVGLDVTWGADEAALSTPFAEQLVVTAARSRLRG